MGCRRPLAPGAASMPRWVAAEWTSARLIVPGPATSVPTAVSMRPSSIVIRSSSTSARPESLYGKWRVTRVSRSTAVNCPRSSALRLPPTSDQERCPWNWLALPRFRSAGHNDAAAEHASGTAPVVKWIARPKASPSRRSTMLSSPGSTVVSPCARRKLARARAHSEVFSISPSISVKLKSPSL